MKKLLILCLLGSAIIFSSCNNYGKRVKVSDKTEVYIKDKATEDEAKQFGNYLDNTYKAENDRAFQLSKKDDGYTIKMVIDKNAYKKNTEVLDQSFMALRFLFASQVFKADHVKLILTDDKFNDIKTVKDTTYTE